MSFTLLYLAWIGNAHLPDFLLLATQLCVTDLLLISFIKTIHKYSCNEIIDENQQDNSFVTRIDDMNVAWAKVDNKISETKLTYYQSTCHYQDAVSKLCCLQNRHIGIFAGGQKLTII